MRTILGCQASRGGSLISLGEIEIVANFCVTRSIIYRTSSELLVISLKL